MLELVPNPFDDINKICSKPNAIIESRAARHSAVSAFTETVDL